MESDFGPVQSLLEFTVPLDTTDHWLVGRASLVSTAWLRLSQQALQSVATAVVSRLDTHGEFMKPREKKRLELLLGNCGEQFYAHPLTLRVAGVERAATPPKARSKAPETVTREAESVGEARPTAAPSPKLGLPDATPTTSTTLWQRVLRFFFSPDATSDVT